jgi:hypothetical protein
MSALPPRAAGKRALLNFAFGPIAELMTNRWLLS